VLLERMVARQSICLRRLGDGSRAREVSFGRFLANGKVTAQRLIEGWSVQTRRAAVGRHVLAIQDTSEIITKSALPVLCCAEVSQASDLLGTGSLSNPPACALRPEA
jgi:hypothetical protein